MCSPELTVPPRRGQRKPALGSRGRAGSGRQGLLCTCSWKRGGESVQGEHLSTKTETAGAPGGVPGLVHCSPLGCYCSVAKSCLTLCDPMDRSTPDFPILHHLPEFAQTHVHFILCCPQSFPVSGSFSMSWLFTSGGQSIRASASASVLPMNI